MEKNIYFFSNIHYIHDCIERAYYLSNVGQHQILQMVSTDVVSTSQLLRLMIAVSWKKAKFEIVIYQNKDVCVNKLTKISHLTLKIF